MSKQTLTITMNANWRGALRAAGKRATVRRYQGEVLNFETAGSLFGKLTERRWALVHELQGRGADVGARTGTPRGPRCPARPR
jgi:hypothetical protein